MVDLAVAFRTSDYGLIHILRIRWVRHRIRFIEEIYPLLVCFGNSVVCLRKFYHQKNKADKAMRGMQEQKWRPY